MEQAKQYFDNHGATDTLYFTADNLAFFEEQDAMNHANGLDDATIIAMTRAEADAAATYLAEEYAGDEEYDPLDEPDAE